MQCDSTLIAPPGPSCRQPISSPKLFTLEAFNSPKPSTSSKKGKRRASGRPFEFATDSMDVDESDSDDGFIVPDDEDYEPRPGKKYAKRNVVLSDDDEYDDVIIPAVKPEAKPKASVGEMNEDEISTKMQVRPHRLMLFLVLILAFQRMMDELIALKKSHPDQKVQRIPYMFFLSLIFIQSDRCHLPVDRLPRDGFPISDQ